MVSSFEVRRNRPDTAVAAGIRGVGGEWMWTSGEWRVESGDNSEGREGGVKSVLGWEEERNEQMIYCFVAA